MRQVQFAQAYLRLALRLDPGRDEAWVLVGDLLNQSDDHQGAIEAYGHVAPGAPHYASAQSKIAWAWNELGDKAKAIEVARGAVTAAPNDRDAAVALADLLRVNSRWDESVAVLEPLIAREASAPDWRLLYLRAVALEQAGRWPEAERDLQAALKVNPDEPELLNFLGYSWIDRNERLAEALSDGGKALMPLGDYTKALSMQERAPLPMELYENPSVTRGHRPKSHSMSGQEPYDPEMQAHYGPPGMSAPGMGAPPFERGGPPPGPGAFDSFHPRRGRGAGDEAPRPGGAGWVFPRRPMPSEAEAQRIETAVKKVLAQGYRTADIAGPDDVKVSTSAMGDAVLKELDRSAS